MRVRFSTDHVPPRDREQFWLDFLAKEVMKVTPSQRPDSSTFRAQLDAHVAGRFTLYEFHASHQRGGRTAADLNRDREHTLQIRRFPHEYFYSAAPTRTAIEEVRVAPGDLSVSSSEWLCSGAMKDGYRSAGC